ncbi:MAG: AAA family ATPase [Mycobacteriales bacterium]
MPGADAPAGHQQPGGHQPEGPPPSERPDLGWAAAEAPPGLPQRPADVPAPTHQREPTQQQAPTHHQAPPFHQAPPTQQPPTQRQAQGHHPLQGHAAQPGFPPGQRGRLTTARGPGPQVTVDDLTPQSLIRAKRSPTPEGGWRRAVYAISAHAVNPGQSRQQVERQELIRRATAPVHGCHRIAVISLKGGVGKTTMTICFGATLASLRGDRVIAVDANPDRGTLSGKIPLQTTATVRNLLNDVGHIERYSDVRRFTSQSSDRLEVLASESDPSVSQAFSEQDYRTVAGVLERFYNIVLTDCGTGLLHSAMAGVLALAHQIVVVSSGSVDGARSASATIDWLEAHGYSQLVRGSVAVINSVRPKSGGVDIEKLEQHFASRCRSVTLIPYDPHLEEGAEVDLAELRPETRTALLSLAASIAEGFAPQPDDGARGPLDRPDTAWQGGPARP